MVLVDVSVVGYSGRTPLNEVYKTRNGVKFLFIHLPFSIM